MSKVTVIVIQHKTPTHLSFCKTRSIHAHTCKISLGEPDEEAPKTVVNDLSTKLWFHGPMTRQEAENVLSRNGDFLVRESTTNPGQYVLSGQQNGYPKHLLLVDPDGVVSFLRRKIYFFLCVHVPACSSIHRQLFSAGHRFVFVFLSVHSPTGACAQRTTHCLYLNGNHFSFRSPRCEPRTSHLTASIISYVTIKTTRFPSSPLEVSCSFVK